MADQKRWFKVWTSIALDPTFLSLPMEFIGYWVILGAWTAAHGEGGVLHASKEAILHTLRLRDGDVTVILQKIPHVKVENRDGEFTVTFLNWQKYQEDSTHATRQKRYRDKARDGLRREEKRRESPISPRSAKDNQVEVDTLALLNTLAGTIWKPGKAYGGGLRSRIEEGVTPEDLAAVVRLKVSRWLKDEKMRSYLTPKTLFGKENFERYVAEIHTPSLPSIADPYAKLPHYVTCDRCHETYDERKRSTPHTCNLQFGTA